MKRKLLSFVPLLAIILVIAATPFALGGERRHSASQASVAMAPPAGAAPQDSMTAADVSPGTRTAVLAGGCFWGMQAVFEDLKGVTKVWAGYSGGSASTAHYEMVSTGTTGHAESVEILFDPAVISYDTLLKVFFTVAHNPTELNYQTPDHGTQYRSVIFYANDQQKKQADQYIAKLEREKVFSKPIVTQVVPLTAFYKAEEYHQDFMKKHPYYPYIVYWDVPKIKHLEQMYPELVKDSSM